MAENSPKGTEHRVTMGLGEAVLRLVHVEVAYANNLDVPADLKAERELIVEALNQHGTLDLGFDCDADGVPDTVEIFKESAASGCCRILPLGISGRKRQSSSRSKR
jgi:hypothetical protein